jgi:gliding motility-associated-like protein
MKFGRAGCVLLLVLSILFANSQDEKSSVDFTITRSIGCTPLITNFIDNTPLATSWLWNFGNGNSSILQNPSATFFAGEHVVSLTAWNGAGEQLGNRQKAIEAFELPNVEIAMAEEHACNYNTIAFGLKTNSHTITKYNWNFGSGDFSTSPNPTRTFSSGSKHSIKIKVEDVNGCEYSASLDKTISNKDAKPLIGVRKETITCSVPIKLSLNEISNHRFDSLLWNFGDGQTSKNKQTSNVYSDYGKYWITLKAINKYGCVVSDDALIEIKNTSAYTPSIDQEILCNPGTVNGFMPNPPGVFTYALWDFGDYTDYVLGNSVSHNYKDTGTFLVRIIHWVGACKSEKHIKVRVLNEEEPKDITAGIEQETHCKSIELTLHDYNYKEKNHWSIGSTSIPSKDTAQTVLVYNGSSVCFNTTYGENDVCQAKWCFDVTDDRMVFSPYTACVGTVCESLVYELNANQENGKTCQVKWFVDDSLVSQNYNYSVVFSKRKKYTIRFESVDSAGCVFIKTLNISIPSIPKPFDIVSDVYYKECPPAVCNFKAVENGPVAIKAITWSFGDGNQSTMMRPQNFYSKPGTYSVNVRAVYTNGCVTDSFVRDFIEVGGPRGELVQYVNSGCVPFRAEIELKKLKDVKYYVVDYGDGTSDQDSGKTLISHTYITPHRVYKPKIVLVDKNGCPNSLTVSNIITNPAVNITKLDIVGHCSNQPVDATALVLAKGYPTSVQWILDDQHISTGVSKTVRIRNVNPGLHTLSLIANNTRTQCSDTISREFEVYYIEAAIDILKDSLCINEPVQVAQKSVLDHQASSHEWYEKDSLIYSGFVLSKKYKTPGLKSIKYIVSDIVGCVDSIEFTDTIRVGDTVNQPVKMSVVSSPTNYKNEVHFEKGNPFDFRAYKIWLVDDTPLLLDSVADVNTLSYSYLTDAGFQKHCYVVVVSNLCNTPIDPTALPKHCTVELKTRADTNKVELAWNPYVGKENISKYDLYRSKNGEPFELMKSVDSGVHVYEDTNTLCHSVYSYSVATRFEGESVYSMSDTSMKKPPFKNAIPEHFPFLVSFDEEGTTLVVKTSSYYPQITSRIDSAFYTLWDNDRVTFSDRFDVQKDSLRQYQVTSKSKQYYVKSSYKNECGETSNKTKICNTIQLKVHLNDQHFPLLDWEEYNYWPSGVHAYLIQRKVSDNTPYADLALIFDKTSYTDNTALLECMDYAEYRVIAKPYANKVGHYSLTEEDQSISNSVRLLCDPLVYIPTAFTPDGNRLNETFRPNTSYCKNSYLEVYNSYGEKVIGTRDCLPEWDGTYREVDAPAGVYMYVLKVTGLNDKEKVYTGTVTLLR